MLITLQTRIQKICDGDLKYNRRSTVTLGELQRYGRHIAARDVLNNEAAYLYQRQTASEKTNCEAV